MTTSADANPPIVSDDDRVDLYVLVTEISRRLADRKPEENDLRREIRASIARHGLPVDDLPSAQARILHMHARREITVRSVHDDLPPDDISDVRRLEKWYVSRSDADKVRVIYGWRWEPLSAFIADVLNAPAAQLPVPILERVDREFSPLTWDSLSPGQRSSLAQQKDIQHDPALEQVNQRWFDHWCEVDRVKRQIADWERMSDHGTPSEAIIKERKLDELRAALSRLEQEADAAAATTSPVENPSSLSQRGLNKEQIITAFGGLVKTNLSKALADGAKWVLPARLAKGTPGRRHPSIWDPVVLAVALQDEKGAAPHKLKQAFLAHDFLSPWRERWEEVSTQ